MRIWLLLPLLLACAEPPHPTPAQPARPPESTSDDPGLQYTADDPRLTDPDYAWAAQQLVAGECTKCHRSTLTDEQLPEACPSIEWCRGALRYYDADALPTWSDSASDDILRAIGGGYRASAAAIVPAALPSDDPERLEAFVSRELLRRAVARIQ
jgi:hypothetical protein